MTQSRDSQSDMPHDRAVLLFGDQPWTRDLVLKEALASGLRVVIAKLQSDASETIVAQFHDKSRGEATTRCLAHATEVLPDDVNALSDPLLARLRRLYGDRWCVLPLNDYVTEYAAAISARLAHTCYPPASAETVKRKHALRLLWNRLAAAADSRLAAVECCYVEFPGFGQQVVCSPSPGFEALAEDSSFIVKPDELSSSIEIHYAGSKSAALDIARDICVQLRDKWYEVGRSIGTEVRPRVIIESAIGRSPALHPGAEYSVEFVSFQGQHFAVGVTQKWISPEFIETGQLFPAESFPAALRPGLEAAVSGLLRQLDVSYGVSHWEFIVTADERLALVEGHLRPAGDRIMELVEHSSGHSPTRQLCEALAGREAEFAFPGEKSCGIFWMIPQRPVAKVTRVEMAAAAGAGWCKDLYVNQGGILAAAGWARASDWLSRYAHVMVTGGGGQEVMQRCREVAQGVKLYEEGGAVTPLKLAIDD
jgi:hypothetical protein